MPTIDTALMKTRALGKRRGIRCVRRIDILLFKESIEFFRGDIGWTQFEAIGTRKGLCLSSSQGGALMESRFRKVVRLEHEGA